MTIRGKMDRGCRMIGGRDPLMIRGVLLAGCLILAVPAAPAAVPPQGAEAPAQSAPPAQFPLGLQSADGAFDTRHLTLRASARPSTAAPGARVTLLLDITPKPKMHVYAPEQKDVIPVTLTLAPTSGIRAGALRVPPSEAYFFAPLKETQRVYSEPFRIEQAVTLAATRVMRERARTGDTIRIAGSLRYQACDDTICYLPQEVPVSWTIRLVADRGAR